MVTIKITQKFGQSVTLLTEIRLSEKTVSLLAEYAKNRNRVSTAPETEKFFDITKADKDFQASELVEWEEGVGEGNWLAYRLTKMGRLVVEEMMRQKIIG